MILTRPYAVFHRACITTAREHDLAPHDVRMLVAVYEQGDPATTAELEESMCSEGTAIRRSLLALRPHFLTGGNVRGQRAPIYLTALGRDVARQCRSRVA